MNDAKNKTLEQWTGNFGDEYISRNEFSKEKVDEIVRAFSKIIGSLSLNTILEVGSNIGNNLCALNEIFKENLELYAVEPNKTAFNKLLSSSNLINIKNAWNCNAYDIPMEDCSVDMVFTSGVLIHIHPDNLDSAIDEIYRISKKYILCSEYFSHEPEEKKYHGQSGLLFKRDFGAYYLDHFKDKIKCIDYGFLWQRDYSVFDNRNWWLFEK